LTKDLQDKVAIVTGGTSGIGREAVNSFAKPAFCEVKEDPLANKTFE